MARPSCRGADDASFENFDEAARSDKVQQRADAQKPEAGLCGDWCANDPAAWGVKCDWDGCNGCNGCFAAPQPSPSAKHSADSIERDIERADEAAARPAPATASAAPAARQDVRKLSPPLWCVNLEKDRCDSFYVSEPGVPCRWDAPTNMCVSTFTDPKRLQRAAIRPSPSPAPAAVRPSPSPAPAAVRSSPSPAPAAQHSPSPRSSSGR